MLAKFEPKEYNKLEDTDYKMEEYVRVPKDEYDKLKEQISDLETALRLQIKNVTLLEQENDKYEETVGLYQNALIHATNKAEECLDKIDNLKEWLEEEIKNRQDKIDFYENDYKYDMYAEAVCEPTVYKLRQEVKAYKEVLERLG
jgi:chromosome segregation ATPase